MNQKLNKRSIGEIMMSICLLLMVQSSFVWAAAGTRRTAAAPAAQPKPAAATSASAVKVDDLVGEWAMTMLIMGETKIMSTLTISKKADGTLAAKIGRDELTSVKLDGQKLTFTRSMKFGDMEITSNFSGTFKDGQLTGTMSSEMGGDSPVTALKRKPMLPVVGQWDIKYKAGDKDIAAKLIISQKADGALEGKWTGEPEENTVSDVKFANGKLTLTKKSKAETAAYEGAVKDNTMTGTLKAVKETIKINGERVGAALIGKWEMTTTPQPPPADAAGGMPGMGPMGPMAGLMVIEPDLSGRYEMFMGENPMKDLKIEGDQVSFYYESPDFGGGGETVKNQFKGKLDGKTLKGKMSGGFGGDNEVTGKKIE